MCYHLCVHHEKKVKRRQSFFIVRLLLYFFTHFADYVRIILNLASFYNMTERPFLTVALYFSGGIILDVADGVSARYFNSVSDIYRISSLTDRGWLLSQTALLVKRLI